MKRFIEKWTAYTNVGVGCNIVGSSEEEVTEKMLQYLNSLSTLTEGFERVEIVGEEVHGVFNGGIREYWGYYGIYSSLENNPEYVSLYTGKPHESWDDIRGILETSNCGFFSFEYENDEIHFNITLHCELKKHGFVYHYHIMQPVYNNENNYVYDNEATMDISQWDLFKTVVSQWESDAALWRYSAC
jgi:hypothetical protein